MNETHWFFIDFDEANNWGNIHDLPHEIDI